MVLDVGLEESGWWKLRDMKGSFAGESIMSFVRNGGFRLIKGMALQDWV